jgi:hypothetical protein
MTPNRDSYRNLRAAAEKFRDAFTYDPGHSDLDNEQPIHVTVTLGDWRKLNWALMMAECDGPRDEAKRFAAAFVHACDDEGTYFGREADYHAATALLDATSNGVEK